MGRAAAAAARPLPLPLRTLALPLVCCCCMPPGHASAPHTGVRPMPVHLCSNSLKCCSLQSLPAPNSFMSCPKY